MTEFRLSFWLSYMAIFFSVTIEKIEVFIPSLKFLLFLLFTDFDHIRNLILKNI